MRETSTSKVANQIIYSIVNVTWKAPQINIVGWLINVKNTLFSFNVVVFLFFPVWMKFTTLKEFQITNMPKVHAKKWLIYNRQLWEG